jgi:hypothetical protein
MWRTKAVNRQKAEDLTTQVVFGAIAAEFPAGPSGNALRRSACFWLTCGSRKWRNDFDRSTRAAHDVQPARP